MAWNGRDYDNRGQWGRGGYGQDYHRQGGMLGGQQRPNAGYGRDYGYQAGAGRGDWTVGRYDTPMRFAPQHHVNHIAGGYGRPHMMDYDQAYRPAVRARPMPAPYDRGFRGGRSDEGMNNAVEAIQQSMRGGFNRGPAAPYTFDGIRGTGPMGMSYSIPYGMGRGQWL